VANKSLTYWLNDVCDACAGRGYQQIAATPALSDMACKDCSGSGKKPLFCDTRIRNQLEDMVGTLDEMTLHAAGQAMKKLAARMEV
jgi:DnaJ-class molecular chaperone